MNKNDQDERKREEEEEEGKKPKFKVVDRRRINAEEVEASEEPSEPEPEPEPEKEEPEEPKKESTPEEPPEEKKTTGDSEAEGMPEASEDPLAYRNIIMSFLQTLVTVVWVHLGLVPHPQTQLVMKKMEEARKAIDLYESLYNAVKDDLPDKLKPEVERLLEDMKANYISQL